MQGELAGAETEIKSLDDVPAVAGVAARQLFFVRWYRALALVPFTVVIFISLKFFADSPVGKFWLAAIYATLIWSIGVAVYAFYVTFCGVSCPVCGYRFGIGEQCRNCGLPRHGDLIP